MTSSWRNPPATATVEQLAAVNELLQSIGQAPVTTLDTSNPDVAMAWNTLVSTSRNVQAEGWTFNREFHYQMTRSSAAAYTNWILIPTNMLQCDLSDERVNKGHDSVMRSTSTDVMFLYDREKHSNTWDYDPHCDVLWMFNWETLPVPIQNFIIARASATMALRAVGDSGQYSMLKEIETYTRTQALEYDNNQGDFSMLTGDPQDFHYTPYEVARSLQRF